MPATLSILTNVFADAKERARAIGVWAGVAGLGIAIGPVTGGWLLAHFWWGSVFLVNLPIVAIALLAGRVLVPTSRDPSPRRLDPAGTVLSFVGLAGVLYGIIEAPSQGWTHGVVVAAFGVGLAMLAAFVAWELHTDHPVLDMRFFRNPRFSAASLAITLVFFALFGTIFFLTQYLQFVLGYGTLRAGLAIAPIALALMISAPLAPVLTARVGTKVMVATGLAVAAGGLVILSTARVHSGYDLVLATIMVLGVGMGLAMAPATDSIMGSLPKEKAGVGSAVNDTTRMVGGSLGVAVLGSLLIAGYHATIGGSAALAELPPAAAATAHDSLGGAVEVAARLGGTASQSLLADTTQAFVHAMSHAVLAGAAVALMGALIALIWLPARAATPTNAGVDAAPGFPPAALPRAQPLPLRTPRGTRSRGIRSGDLGFALDEGAAISVRGLRKSYGRSDAVRGVSFDVAVGEVFGFLGPNGAGKTTTIEILEGYRERTAGDVKVLGVDPGKPTRRWRERIGLVLQESELDPNLTVRETVALFASFYPSPLPVEETIELTGLGDKGGARIGTLSGGQRRRADVALGVVGDPDLVFLDEPTTGFDPSARRGAWNMIDGLRQLGKTIFLTTHYMDEAQHLADRIAILRSGALVAVGSVDEIGTGLGADAIVRFRLPAGVAADEIASVAASPVDISGDIATIRARDPQPVLYRLTTWGEREVRSLEGLEVVRPTLEDMFLELTKTAADHG
jgi:EmrB/QacA subfamily drug resistance transporter